MENVISASLEQRTIYHKMFSHQEIFFHLGLVWEDPSGGNLCLQQTRGYPFQEFRIISLRGANVPHGHSQDFPNSLDQIDDNGCNTQKIVVSILFSVVSYEMDFLSNGFSLKCGKPSMNGLQTDIPGLHRSTGTFTWLF